MRSATRRRKRGAAWKTKAPGSAAASWGATTVVWIAAVWPCAATVPTPEMPRVSSGAAAVDSPMGTAWVSSDGQDAAVWGPKGGVGARGGLSGAGAALATPSCCTTALVPPSGSLKAATIHVADLLTAGGTGAEPTWPEAEDVPVVVAVGTTGGLNPPGVGAGETAGMSWPPEVWWPGTGAAPTPTVAAEPALSLCGRMRGTGCCSSVGWAADMGGPDPLALAGIGPAVGAAVGP